MTDQTSEQNGHKKARSAGPIGSRSLGELVATLSRDLALLVHQEIELLKSDVLAAVKKTAIAAAGLVVAVVFLLIAVPVLSIAAALGIHGLGISLGWSFLIVAGGYLLLAVIAAFVGLRLLRRAKVSKRGVDSVKADIQAIARKPTPSRAP
jgi:Putative Actinobacterial Holin-X, holin superfamily III